MIGKNFIYCRPETEEDAAALHAKFTGEGKTTLYYGGGSEIITMCAAGSIAPDAVIDLKRIPSLNALREEHGFVAFGAACTLDAIRTSGRFPLLGEVGGRVADHTNQCRITLGGNLCGTIIYRETALPLLLTDAELVLYGSGGLRTVSIWDVFNGRMRLSPGEFLVSARVKRELVRKPHAHIKRVFSEKIGYPAVTAAAVTMDGDIRVALSGICSHPFRSRQMEQAINDRSLPRAVRARRAAACLPEPPRTDCEGSGPYRLHLLTVMLEQMIEFLEPAATG